MECQDYYEHHAPPLPDMKDRCALKQIEASTAACVPTPSLSYTTPAFADHHDSVSSQVNFVHGHFHDRIRLPKPLGDDS